MSGQSAPPGLSSAWPGAKEFFDDKTIKTCQNTYLIPNLKIGGVYWSPALFTVSCLAYPKSGSPMLRSELKPAIFLIAMLIDKRARTEYVSKYQNVT